MKWLRGIIAAIMTIAWVTWLTVPLHADIRTAILNATDGSTVYNTTECTTITTNEYLKEIQCNGSSIGDLIDYGFQLQLDFDYPDRVHFIQTVSPNGQIDFLNSTLIANTQGLLSDDGTKGILWGVTPTDGKGSPGLWQSPDTDDILHTGAFDIGATNRVFIDIFNGSTQRPHTANTVDWSTFSNFANVTGLGDENIYVGFDTLATSNIVFVHNTADAACSGSACSHLYNGSVESGFNILYTHDTGNFGPPYYEEPSTVLCDGSGASTYCVLIFQYAAGVPRSWAAFTCEGAECPSSDPSDWTDNGSIQIGACSGLGDIYSQENECYTYDYTQDDLTNRVYWDVPMLDDAGAEDPIYAIGLYTSADDNATAVRSIMKQEALWIGLENGYEMLFRGGHWTYDDTGKLWTIPVVYCAEDHAVTPQERDCRLGTHRLIHHRVGMIETVRGDGTQTLIANTVSLGVAQAGTKLYLNAQKITNDTSTFADNFSDGSIAAIWNTTGTVNEQNSRLEGTGDGINFNGCCANSNVVIPTEDEEWSLSWIQPAVDDINALVGFTNSPVPDYSTCWASSCVQMVFYFHPSNTTSTLYVNNVGYNLFTHEKGCNYRFTVRYYKSRYEWYVGEHSGTCTTSAWEGENLIAIVADSDLAEPRLVDPDGDQLYFTYQQLTASVSWIDDVTLETYSLSALQIPEEAGAAAGGGTNNIIGGGIFGDGLP
jgi:hypothetical protein